MLTVRRRPNGVPSLVNVFEDFFNQNYPEKFIGHKGDFNPSVNVVESDVNYQLEFAVPGFAKTDFDVKIEKEFIVVSGKKEVQTEAKEKNYTRKEFTFNSFTRTFNLPENVETADVSASYENGILHVTLPKKEVKAASAVKKIDIK